MQFDQTASFEDNLARLKAELERIDPECARILFDNMSKLTRDSDVARNRQAIQEFNQAVLAALEALP
jgi:HD-GYP domain-containing protein (c-di-GMP phosphodiesterase class II)